METPPTVTIQFRTYPQRAKDWRERTLNAQDMCADIWYGEGKKRLRFAGTNQDIVIAHQEEIYQNVAVLLERDVVNTEHFRLQLVRTIPDIL